MAIIDVFSGFYGYTLETTDSNSSSRNGLVNKCIIAIRYPLHKTEVNVEISSGTEDWAIETGNNSIITCHNPIILSANKDNTIVQFTLDEYYPSNSPCTLLYHSDSAYFKVTDSTRVKEFEENSPTGYFGFTTVGFNSVLPNLEVGRLDKSKIGIVTVPIPFQKGSLVANISNGPNDWSVKMGNGQIITARNTEVIAVGNTSIIFKLELDEYYPSNSPFMLCYKSTNASINVDVDPNDPVDFIPVSEIIDIPTTMLSGETLDLYISKVLPWNCTDHNISWTVIEGPGTIKNRHYLYAENNGIIVLEASIEKGSANGDTFNRYSKRFNINVSKNVITIDTQPSSNVNVYFGKINDVINIVAHSTSKFISFQWYKNSNNTYAGASPIEGATEPELQFPISLTKGNYYFFCKITSPGAETVNSRICHLYVSIERTGITIRPFINEIGLETTHQFHIEQQPAEADLPPVAWFTSNSNIADIDSTGKIKTKLLPGNVTITAKTIDGLHENIISFNVKNFIPVQSISGVSKEINIGSSLRLSGKINPENATNKTIQWSLINAGDTGATLSNDLLYVPRTIYPLRHQDFVMVRAYISNGSGFYNDYYQEFRIHLGKEHIPIEDINIDFPTVYITDRINLAATILPSTASVKNINYSLINTNSSIATISGNTLIANGAGRATIRATVINGGVDKRNYVKDFIVNIQNSAFIDVQAIALDNMFCPFDPNLYMDQVIPLTYQVIPSNATNKNASIKCIDDGNGIIIFNESTKSFTYDISKIPYNINGQLIVKFRFTIKNGTKYGDLIYNTQFQILPRNGNIFIPLTKISIKKPIITRALMPIIEMIQFEPLNTSVKNENNTLDNLTIEYIPDDPDSQIPLCKWGNDPNNPYNMLNMFGFQEIYDRPIFDWTKKANYVYSYSSWQGKIRFTVKDGDVIKDENGEYNPYNAVRKDFIYEQDFTIHEPFIAVKEVALSLHSSIPQDVWIPLNPIVGSKNGISFPNPVWDNDTPTWTDINWRISGTKDPSYNGEFTYNIKNFVNGPDIPINKQGHYTAFKVKGLGKITISCTINEGILEDVTWYESSQNRMNYSLPFFIDVENNFVDKEVVRIKLKNGNIHTFKESQYYMLASNFPNNVVLDLVDSTNTNISIKKSDIIAVDFCLNGNFGVEKISVSSSDIIGNPSTLRFFGYDFPNCTAIYNLKHVNISGEECMENFFACSSGPNINTVINLPSSINGKRCLRYAFSGRDNFNQEIKFNNTNIVGDECLKGFLKDCPKFNKSISFPSNITGNNCLDSVLMNCSSFNQIIQIPENISGNYMLQNFLRGASSFNQTITFPTSIWNNYGSLFQILRDADNFTSSISIPAKPDTSQKIVNEQSFATLNKNSNLYKLGISITGNGANNFKTMLYNSDIPPYKKIR